MDPHALEPAGWALLLGSWVVISGLVLFCVRRVLKSRDPSQED